MINLVLFMKQLYLELILNLKINVLWKIQIHRSTKLLKKIIYHKGFDVYCNALYSSKTNSSYLDKLTFFPLELIRTFDKL